MPSVDGLTPTWSFGVSSQASSTDLPSAPPPTPTIIGEVCTMYIRVFMFIDLNHSTQRVARAAYREWG